MEEVSEVKSQYVEGVLREDRRYFIEKGLVFGFVVNSAILLAQVFVKFVNPEFSLAAHGFLELILGFALIPRLRPLLAPVASRIILPLFCVITFVKVYTSARAGVDAALLAASWSYLIATMATMLLTPFSTRWSAAMGAVCVAATLFALQGTDNLLRFAVLHVIGLACSLFYMNLRLVAVRRAAGLEFDNKHFLEQEMELLATSQRLLLPQQATISTPSWALASHFVAAGQVSGDWWWTRQGTESLECLIGDVAGHGGGAAMIAAMVVGAWRAQTVRAEATIPEALAALSELLVEVGGRNGKTTMSALHCQGSEAVWWSAGAPPMLVLRRDGKVETFFAPGSPLGYPAYKVTERRIALATGDRLLVFSDGLVEMKNATGGEFGVGRLTRRLAKTGALSLDGARADLASELEAFRGERRLEDDVTFLLLERCA